MIDYLCLPDKYQSTDIKIIWKYYKGSEVGCSAGGYWINAKNYKPVSLFDVYGGDGSHWLAEAYTVVKGCHWCYTESELLQAKHGVASLLKAYYKIIEDNQN